MPPYSSTNFFLTFYLYPFNLWTFLLQGECRLVARSSQGLEKVAAEIEKVVAGEGGGDRDNFSPPEVHELAARLIDHPNIHF